MVERAAVTPEKVSFPVPCWGTKKEKAEIEIKNDSGEKLTFKMKVTHQDRFQVEPAFGFVEPNSSTMVKCRPRPFNDLPTKGNHEHFTVLLHAVPKGASSVAKQIWKHGSNDEPLKPKRFTVKIEYHKKERKDKSKKKEKKKAEEKSEDEEEEEEEEEEEKEDDEDEADDEKAKPSPSTDSDDDDDE